MRVLLIAIVLSLAAPFPAVDLAGTWNVVIPAGSERRPDGSKAEWKEIRGTLELTQKGDALTGTWRVIDTWKMTGRADADGRFALESDERQVPANRDGTSGSAPGRWVMRGALKDGALAGTAALVIGGREPIVHKWTASRK